MPGPCPHTFRRRRCLEPFVHRNAGTGPNRFRGPAPGQMCIRDRFKEIGPKYADRNGGYTRIVRIGPRRGDAAEMAIIQLV